jgi:hypothetical protein
VTLRGPDLGCESLPGFGRLAAKNVVYVGAARGGGPVHLRCLGAGAFRGRLPGAEGAVRGPVLEDVWSAPFEDWLPVRRFAARKGQQHLSGLWWSATTGGHVGFESWLDK